MNSPGPKAAFCFFFFFFFSWVDFIVGGGGGGGGVGEGEVIKPPKKEHQGPSSFGTIPELPPSLVS